MPLHCYALTCHTLVVLRWYWLCNVRSIASDNMSALCSRRVVSAVSRHSARTLLSHMSAPFDHAARYFTCFHHATPLLSNIHPEPLHSDNFSAQVRQRMKEVSVRAQCERVLCYHSARLRLCSPHLCSCLVLCVCFFAVMRTGSDSNTAI